MDDDDGPREAVVIERTFDATVHTVWELWTDPAHLAGWYGPPGATIPDAQMDVRVGGRRRVTMEVSTPNGPMRLRFDGAYLEVEEDRRLVYTESMVDEDGAILLPEAMGMPPGHPATTEVHVDLHEVGARTRLVLTHVGVPKGSPGAAGWAAALEKLAATIDAARR